jgi:hypothetical protein
MGKQRVPTSCSRMKSTKMTYSELASLLKMCFPTPSRVCSSGAGNTSKPGYSPSLMARFVSPRATRRANVLECGHTDKANRPSQSASPAGRVSSLPTPISTLPGYFLAGALVNRPNAQQVASGDFHLAAQSYRLSAGELFTFVLHFRRYPLEVRN